MPNDNKKRGPRGRRLEEKKRQLEEDDAPDSRHHDKRRKTSNPDAAEPPGNLYQQHFGDDAPAPEGAESVFYGLLDEEEQEYFKKADDLLEVNQFNDPEERYLFLANLYKEADGKELKLACSQSCSRLMERLILLSAPDQLKRLFQRFNGHFLNLVQHRFASHCCEALFIQSAPIVPRELAQSSSGSIDTMQHEQGTNGGVQNGGNKDEIFVSMENLFLFAANELEGNLGFLMTDRFASHTLRVLLTIMAGQQVDDLSNRTLLQSKRKENIDVVRSEQPKEAPATRAVPESFSVALAKMIKGSLLGLDTNFLRALATHPTGNPTLQLLLQLELTHFGKSRAKDEDSIIRRLLPDDLITEGSQSASFINGLVYETIGSRLLETIIEYAPGKTFKSLYREFFKDRMGSLARNEIASYVVSKILERLSSEDLQTALDSILPQMTNLVDRGRTAIIKKLAERCSARGIDTQSFANALQEACSEDGGETFSITKLLQLPPPPAKALQNARTAGNIPTLSATSTLSDAQPQAPDTPPSSDPKSTEPSDLPQQATNPVTASSRLHGSLLAQALLQIPGPLSTLIFDALVALPVPIVLQIAIDPTASHTLQSALTSPHATLIFRRKLITRFYSHAASLAQHANGSHVVDAILAGTTGIAFMRERMAEELAEAEPMLRESRTGRMVWRNWKMDLYRRRRAEWVRQTRLEAGNDGFLSFPEEEDDDDEETTKIKKRTSGAVGATVPAVRQQVARSRAMNGPPGSKTNGGRKTALQLAREKYAKNRATKSQPPKAVRDTR